MLIRIADMMIWTYTAEHLVLSVKQIASQRGKDAIAREQVAGLQRLESGAAITPSIADLSDLQNPASEIAQLILGS